MQDDYNKNRQNNSDNGFLYYALGGLLVVMLVIGVMYYASDNEDDGTALTILEPAAGRSVDERTREYGLDYDEEGDTYYDYNEPLPEPTRQYED